MDPCELCKHVVSLLSCLPPNTGQNGMWGSRHTVYSAHAVYFTGHRPQSAWSLNLMLWMNAHHWSQADVSGLCSVVSCNYHKRALYPIKLSHLSALDPLEKGLMELQIVFVVLHVTFLCKHSIMNQKKRTLCQSTPSLVYRCSGYLDRVTTTQLISGIQVTIELI